VNAELTGRDSTNERDLFVLELASPEELPDGITLTSPRFVCLVAWDARDVAEERIRLVARKLLDSGAVYVCSWGADCERVHDLVDSECAGPNPPEELLVPFVMTTGHADMPLEQALWYVLFAAFPDDNAWDGCNSTLAISIGSPVWAAASREAFSDPHAFSKRVLEDERSTSAPASPVEKCAPGTTLSIRRRWAAVITAAILAALAVLTIPPLRSFAKMAWSKMSRQHTVADRVAQFGPAVEARLAPAFDALHLRYPPAQLAYVAFKDTRLLELYARNSSDDPWRFVKDYPVLGASGKLGPKLVEGDEQVPEGIYRVELLNPNSRFHLSLRVSYPNAFDVRAALAEGRTRLGGDIMIHGGSASIGCLAMGDEAAEELFVLAALAISEQTLVIISPTDFRRADAREPLVEPAWAQELYASICTDLQEFERR
jgi:hypothetical protein